MIAWALACKHKLLIADDPTTALDVTIQAQILDLMRELQETLGTAIVLITHDMGVVAENADRVVVMYAGRKVEEASAKDLFEQPGHPYTKGLLGSIPDVEVAAHTRTRRARLNEIKGMVPSLSDLPKGCTFAPRCVLASEECRASYPPLVQYRPGHWVACWRRPIEIARADRRENQSARRRHHRSRPGADAALPPADADDLPGPLRLAQSADVGWRDRRGTVGHSPGRHAKRAPRTGGASIRSRGTAPRVDQGLSA